MTRVIIRFKDGNHVNLVADFIDLRDGLVMVWQGEKLVVIAKVDEVNVCYLTEKRGDT